MFGLGLVTFLHPNYANGRSTQIGGAILDTFDEADYRNGLPATWFELGAGEAKYDASNGDLLVDRTGVPFDTDVTYVELADTMPSDVSIRARTRMRNDDRPTPDPDPGFGPAVSLAARTCFSEIPQHVCGGESDEWVYIDFYSNGEAHTAQSAARGIRERVVATDIRPLEEDVIFQLDAFDEDIKFWVWRPGEPRPAEPLIQYTAEDRPTIDPGGIMFGTVYADAWFRYVQVSDTPITDDPLLFPSEEFVLGDLTVIGSLAGGGDLGNVDLVYVPEPTSVLLLSVGLIIGVLHVGRRNR